MSGELQPLTDEQQQVFDIVSRRLQAGEKLTVVHGLAGTGKSYVLLHLLAQYPHAFATAHWAIAAHNLSEKAKQVGLEAKATTLYSAMKQLIGEDKKGKPVFETREDWYENIVFLDECSVVSQADADDLMAKAAQIVAFGDPGQLLPVKQLVATTHFATPTEGCFLRKIVRQKVDSNIIQQSRRIRDDGCYDSDEWARFFEQDDYYITTDRHGQEFIDADMILTQTNEMRFFEAMEYRKMRGLPEKRVERRERLMVINRNHYAKNLLNGSIVMVMEPWTPGEPLMIQHDGRTRKLDHVAVEGIGKSGNGLINFQFAYTSTVHKVQGAEFRHVFVFDPGRRARDWKRLMYTGVTRAVEKVTIHRAEPLRLD